MKAVRCYFLISGLSGLILFAPVAFGSVHAWSCMTMACVLFFLLSLHPEVISQVRELPVFFRTAVIFVFLVVFIQLKFIPFDRSEVFYELLKWLALASAFMLTQRLTCKTIVWLIWLIILLGAAESLYGIYQVLSGNEMVLWRIKEVHRGFVTGTYLNRNHFAGFMEIVIGLQLGVFLWVLRKRQILGVLFLGILLMISFMGLIQSGSRMGMAALGLSFLFYFSFLWGRTWKTSIFFVVFTGALMGGALYMEWKYLMPRLIEAMDQMVTFEGRLTVWKDAIRLISYHPWLGIGLGNFKWVFPAVQSESLLMAWGHAHNDYIELLTEIGIPAFSIFILAFAQLWVYGNNLLASSKSSLFPLAWGGFVGVTALSLHGLFDFNFAIPANMMIYLLIWGCSIRILKLSVEWNGEEDVL